MSELIPINEKEFTYIARIEGNETSYIGSLYPYGQGWIGREVGQRTYQFNYQFPTIYSAVDTERDVFFQTKESTLERLSNLDLGFYDLPTWLCGSSRAYNPDKFNNVWEVLSYLTEFTDIIALVKSARLSCDPIGSLETGPAIPKFRQCYWLDSNINFSNITGTIYSNGITIRQASSYWDFTTAFDPVYLQVSDNDGILLRNISQQSITELNIENLVTGEYVLPIDNLNGSIADSESVFIWAGSKSLSDTQYLPQANSVSPVAINFDISSNLLGVQNLENFSLKTENGPVFTVPRIPELYSGMSTTPFNWSTYTYPFNLDQNITITSGTSYIISYLPPSGTYNITDINGNLLGIAKPIDARNGWDQSGEFIGLGRRQGEDDFRFGGRQQRVWLTGLLTYTSGSMDRCNRSLSSLFGLNTLINNWKGESSLIPSDTTSIDLIAAPRLDTTFKIRYANKEIFPYSNIVATGTIGQSYDDKLNGAFTTVSTSGYVAYSNDTYKASKVFKCSQDLSAYDQVIVSINNITQIQGKDFILSGEDPSILIFNRYIRFKNLVFEITLSGRNRMKCLLNNMRDKSINFYPWRIGNSLSEINTEFIPSSYKKYLVTGEDPLRDAFMQVSSSSGSIAYCPSGIVCDTLPNGFYTPILINRGPLVKSFSSISDRRFYTPGRTYPTVLGQNLFNKTPNTSDWNTIITKSLPVKIIGYTTDISDPVYI